MSTTMESALATVEQHMDDEGLSVVENPELVRFFAKHFCAFNQRVQEMLELDGGYSRYEIDWCSDDGIAIRRECDQYARGCHLGTDVDKLVIPLRAMHDQEFAHAWAKQRKADREAARKRKIAADEAAYQNERRRQYAALKKEFEK